MANALVPELYVSNLKTSLKFYRDLLGFETVYARDEDQFVYLRKDDAELMLEEIGENSWLSGELKHPFGRGVNLQIKVAAIEALYKACRERSSIIKVPLERRAYRAGNHVITQSQFVVHDPDGYLIRLAEIQA